MLKYLLEKEFKQLFRNAFLPRLFVVLPLTLVIIFPYAATQEVKHLNLVVVDHDRSPWSRRAIDQLAASPSLDLVAVAPSQREAMRQVDRGQADLVVTFAPDFERSLTLGHPAAVDVAANAVNGMKGGVGQSYVLQILADWTRQMQTDGLLP
ncbi:MAG: ABC transporter permease, partial [Bacteroidaceae bacterium]|nr:ABC transporter permease [Bacteroidaceae bacterium]